MGKLSKLRRDIIARPKDYDQLIRMSGSGVTIYKQPKGVKIYSSYYNKGYRNFIKKVLNELRQGNQTR
jgi:hypothetical protein